MDFFQHQETAKKRTARLVFYFIFALLGMIGGTYLIAAFALAYAQYGDYWTASDLWDPTLFAFVTFFTSLVVGLSSGYKILMLRGGGHVVAEELGGRLLDPHTTDPVERKVLNVVEEMALASGVPTPPVYIMDREGGINAFAAGYSPADAVISVTRGCAVELTRDELQGVIAHEFSHILNGDMRLNIRLMGLVFGILVLGMIGYYALRFNVIGGSNNSRNRSGLVVIIIGLGLIIIGSMGTFFGRLLQAAISRQREFLADASAVQFTRNPDGIGGALKKIAIEGSKIRNPHAAEASHMYFASGISSLFSTHPPTEERLKAIYGREII